MKINENMNSPFFILGNPRSGTSLFRLMLNSHPNIIVPPESVFLQWWHEKYKNWSKKNSQNTIDVEEYVHDILNSKKIEDWNLIRQELINKINRLNPSNYGELSSIIYCCYNKFKSDIDLIGDKNNYYIHHLDLINSIYPNAKYIHLIRDGRDVACSYKKIKSLQTNSKYKPDLVFKIKDIALEWSENNFKIEKFLNNKMSLKIRYEDLLIDPIFYLSKVCKYLEIPFHSQMLDFYKVEFNDEPKSTIDWKKKTYEPLDKNNSKKYLTLLSNEEIDSFNQICKKYLLKNNYEL